MSCCPDMKENDVYTLKNKYVSQFKRKLEEWKSIISSSDLFS